MLIREVAADMIRDLTVVVLMTGSKGKERFVDLCGHLKIICRLELRSLAFPVFIVFVVIASLMTASALSLPKKDLTKCEMLSQARNNHR